MLQLNAEQVQALQAIKRARDIRQLSDTLALAFPDVPRARPTSSRRLLASRPCGHDGVSGY